MTNKHAAIKELELRAALHTLLDHVDYQNGACRLNEMIAVVLPPSVIAVARKALER